MNKKAIFLFFFIMFSLKFFDATFANTGLIKNLSFGIILLSIVASVPFFFHRSVGFILPIQIICVAIVISVFMGYYGWGQNLGQSTSVVPYAIWFVFFLFLKIDIPIRTIENVIMIYGALYILLFLFQFTHNHTVYFGMQEEFKEERGVVRINFPGAGVFFLACFIAINKVTSNVSNRLLWATFALVGLLVVVLQVTRQTIVIMVLFYLIHFLRRATLPLKFISILAFVIVGYLFIISESAISEGLIDQQKEDASQGKNYIRILSADYYLTQFSPNIPTKIFGNGFPNNNSSLGKTLIALNDRYGFYLTDVGFVEVYVVFGILGVIGFALIFFKSLSIPVPEKYYYLKYYLWMLFLTSFTADFLISYYYLSATILVLYCYQRVAEVQVIKNERTVRTRAIPVAGRMSYFS